MKELIKKIIDISYKCKDGHIASSLSILDILYVLYKDILNIKSIQKEKLDRDRVILSKGHASLALYVILANFGLLKENLYSFCEFDSNLGGHVCDKIKYVETSTGSLGHGLPIAVGMAMSYKIQDFKKKIYVIIGDGELNEGTNWEAALLASQHKLSNLYCIVDYNHSIENAIKLDSIIDKFKAFNWNTFEINGHNHEDIKMVLSERISWYRNDKPNLILTNTIKGHGCSIMEKNPNEWHHKFPSEKEYEKIMEELL